MPSGMRDPARDIRLSLPLADILPLTSLWENYVEGLRLVLVVGLFF